LEIRHRSVRPISAKHAQASRFLQQSPAERVCDKDSARKLYEKRSYLRCYEPAMADARTDLDALAAAVRAS
ncbi:MAG: hypothetical protein QHC67_13850, partial [Sphingobium sp.]|uniref:hypothetical protein n=1 Tax=Sphingobium sp. TaxID=1912891 RepID=UPI0029B0E976